MTMDEIREFARALEIQSVSMFENREDLIRTIQLAEGSSDCFARMPDCTETNCRWYEDCVKTKVA